MDYKINDDDLIESDDYTCVYKFWQSAMLDWKKIETKGQKKAQKASDSVIKLAGRKNAYTVLSVKLNILRHCNSSFFFLHFFITWLRDSLQK